MTDTPDARLYRAYAIFEESLQRLPDRIGEVGGPEAAAIVRELCEAQLAEIRQKFFRRSEAAE